MATLTEIADAFESADIKRRTVAAVIELVAVIRAEGPSTPKHQARLKWARKSILNALQMSERMQTAVSAHAAVTVEIPDVSDAAIRAAVEALVVKFADANLPEATDAT